MICTSTSIKCLAGLGYGEFWEDGKLVVPSARSVALVKAAFEPHQKTTPAAAGTTPKPSPKGASLPRPRGLQSDTRSSKSTQPEAVGEKGSHQVPVASSTPAVAEPPDPRKAPLMVSWLSKEKAKSLGEPAKWSQLHAEVDQRVASKLTELRRVAALPCQDDLKTKKVIDLKKLELLAIQQRLRREVMVRHTSIGLRTWYI